MLKQSFVMVLGLVAIGNARAQDDSCDDYLSRHFRQDLTPLNEVYDGFPRLPAMRQEFALKVSPSSVYPGHLQASFWVKSVGEQPVREGRNPVVVKVNEYIVRATVDTSAVAGSGPLGSTTGVGPQSGQRAQVVMTLPAAMKLNDCDRVQVHFDSSRSFGQWGCAIYSNDSKTLFVHTRKSSASCLNPRLPVPPRLPTPL